MGKILSHFDIGWPGAISRSVDDIVVSLKNAGSDPIPFGKPVFLTDDGSGVVAFINNGSQTFERFVGFAVRSASKTPDTYPSSQDMSVITGDQAGQWKPGEPVEVLVRGCIAVKTSAGFGAGDKVYIRKSDGKLTPNAGAANSTVELENVRVRGPRDSTSGAVEVIVSRRNLI